MNNNIHPSMNPRTMQYERKNSPDYTYILDKQTGDVNGDQIPDTVYLIGERQETPFYEHIKVVVEDGRTKQRYTIPLYDEYSMAYTPWLFLGNFINLDVNQIMVNLPVGGSGALTYYYVISFLHNKADVILGPEEFVGFSSNLGLEVTYLDGYRVLVKSTKLDQSYILDVSDRKEFYEGTVYDENGKLLKPQRGFIIDLPHLNPIRFDGNVPYKLEAQNAIAGTSHADRLGYTITYWKYDEGTRSWVLDPEMFFIMI